MVSVLQNSLNGKAQPLGEPTFIVGCGHSGTTLMLAMLGAHPLVYPVPYESSLARRRPLEVDWFVRRFNKQAVRAGAVRWVEKTPKHILDIDFLLKHFDEAKILILQRDGRDVACSLFERSGDFDSSVTRWVNDNVAAAAFLDHPRVFVVSYEELIGNPEGTLCKVSSFLGLQPNDSMLSHHESDFRFLGRYDGHRRFERQGHRGFRSRARIARDHRRHRSQQASLPLFDGRNRWRTEMTELQKVRFKQVGGETLIRMGYESDHEW